jgi:hypothetical protein
MMEGRFKVLIGRGVEWILRRDESYRDKTVFQSDNWKIWVSFGGDVYVFHVDIGPLSVAWLKRGLVVKEWRVSRKIQEKQS